MNENRIVRVRNEEINDIISYAARRERVSYQVAFEVLMDMIAAGYVIGEYTHTVLCDKIRHSKRG